MTCRFFLYSPARDNTLNVTLFSESGKFLTLFNIRATILKKHPKNVKYLHKSKIIYTFGLLINKTIKDMATKEKRTKYTLATTDVFQFSYEEYLDFCEENEIEPADENSSEFWDWRAKESDFNWECDMANLKYSPLAKRTFVIVGSLGLWDGRHEIYPTFVYGIDNCIEKCMGGSIQDMDVELDIEKGVIHITARHHDGRNCFDLLMLNRNGEKWAEYAEGKEECNINNYWWTKIKSINEIFG